jgi:hypothetical protein
MSLFRNPSKGPRRRPERTRADREPQHLPVELLLALVAALAVWLTILGLQGEFAGAAKRKLPAPRPLGPANGASVQSVPSFSWQPVRGAAKYEFQLSADAQFKSVVNGDRNGSFFTKNSSASVLQTLADGSYYWRARAVDASDHAGRWSAVRTIRKRWTATPALLGPVGGSTVSYPGTPLVLRWEPVPNAYKYLVTIATDKDLAHSALGSRKLGIETSGTVLAVPTPLSPGPYWWAVTPLDSAKHPGRRSAPASFRLAWPSATVTRVTDLQPDDPRVTDPQFSWNPVAGAAMYQVEVNASEDFAVGSRVCCDEQVFGTSHSPLHLLPNNTYYWRVRAIDLDGNAGRWNVGPSFTKDFDNVIPSVPGLRMRDNRGDNAPAAGASGLPTTDTPIVAWSPVPGASSYEVRVAPWEGFCNWTAGPGWAKTSLTASTAWTPLGPGTSKRPVGNAFPTVANDSNFALVDGVSYCARVRARSDRDAATKEIVSDWTQLGGAGSPAFTYDAADQTCAATAMPPTAYNAHVVKAADLDPGAPLDGARTSRMPLFTWDEVPGACGYFVVVARDREFTKIVDVALTTQAAYAPRTNTTPTTYADETTSYYWVVMPTRDPDGGGLATQATDDFPQGCDRACPVFQKRSVPPTPVAPTGGAGVATQPTFRWTPAEGARSYRIQIADDPTFGTPIADVVTNSTAYTSANAFPPDSTLYWRVRANDENKLGLTWSPTQTFRRRLPVPLMRQNPFGGEAIPVLSWAPVTDAVSYDMHVEQADGTKRDFPGLRSSAFTPVIFYGTGVWHWQVRANFRGGSRVVSGGYAASQPFARRIATPTGLRTTRTNGGALLSWDPARMARRYRVQVSSSDSFSVIVEQVTTENTSWAPRMSNPAYAKAERLYWRVAATDEGNNLGGWASTPLRSLPRARVRTRGSLRNGRSRRVVVTVTGRGGRRLKGATVRVRGAGVIARPRRTNRRGMVRLWLTPRVRGSVRISAERAGYAPGRASLRVR